MAFLMFTTTKEGGNMIACLTAILQKLFITDHFGDVLVSRVILIFLRSKPSSLDLKATYYNSLGGGLPSDCFSSVFAGRANVRVN